jgi:hypothetical protein
MGSRCWTVQYYIHVFVRIFSIWRNHKLIWALPSQVKPADPADTTEFLVTGEADEENEFYHLNLNKPLVAGKQYEIFIPFLAPIAIEEGKLSGLYRSSYIDADGEES